MTLKEFKESLGKSNPPGNIKPSLSALWYDAKGNWDKAHTIAQNIQDYSGSWVHAYLHRKEGDQSNASYWYSRTGKKKPDISLDEEWDQIAEQLLK